MGLNLINKLGPLKGLLLAAWRWDAQLKFDRIKPALTSGASILDIGSGYGTVTEVLRNNGFEVTALDVEDQSVKPELKPLVYDGDTLPFPSRAFNFSLLLTVLHHTSKPEKVLSEAARVGEKVLVIEDIYRNKLQQYLTYFTDSLLNFEFKDHPHSNKSRDGWRQTCTRLGLEFEVIRSDRFLLFFRQETYLISGK
ncbi:MAG: class I SAM-dependent methyltransferase [Roseivirga sp.]|nr:class I SAM-dependent methyltransferase [Roseivirga sp.]